MVLIPDELPDFVHLHASRNARAFRKQKQWESLRKAIRAAERNGIEPKICEALLIGVKSCEDWRSDKKRQFWLGQYQLMADGRRGTAVFQGTADKRETYTERFLERVQTLIILGYIAANGRTRVERRNWYPLANAFEHILTIKKPKNTAYDAKEQLVALVRKRLIRLRDSCDGELPWEAGHSLFQEVYDTFCR
ncbi:hypothetical protein KFF05_16435 [bacterium SCSIO 12827]|nr:hypothetical protein KFF05_16435 [bacterium SCSIO 12827]